MIVTNNKLVENPEVFVSGDYHAVMLRARDLVYEGYELLTHPLFASIRMIFSPVRTIILSNKKISIKKNELSMTMIGDAILKYEKLMENRQPDFQHIDDYEQLDFELFNHAQKELKQFNSRRCSE